jgi:ribosomal protein S12 methylthiotransferase accessory factor
MERGSLLQAMHKLSSSLRSRSARDTLEMAKPLAAKLGITRVTDTTWLDRIGIPVFASIRPGARSGSLCVNAGKGRRPDEAEIGAYMEAIEFAFAEYGRSVTAALSSSPRAIADTLPPSLSFSSLCPMYGQTVDPDGPMRAVDAESVLDGKRVLVPAELVFIPYPENDGQRVFGESSNGLCSGNTVLEASIHGLCELMERDVQAFDFLYDQSALVHLDDVPVEVKELVELVEDAGLELAVRYTANGFDFPYFQAFLTETSVEMPVSLASGSGLHCSKSIALVRAICEAAQSRLSHIHGGRDDIIRRVKYFDRVGRDAEVKAIEMLRSKAFANEGTLRYSNIPEPAVPENLEAAWKMALDAIGRAGVRSVFRVSFTDPRDDLQVVRIIAPGLESFEPNLKRVGARLATYARTYL